MYICTRAAWKCPGSSVRSFTSPRLPSKCCVAGCCCAQPPRAAAAHSVRIVWIFIVFDVLVTAGSACRHRVPVCSPCTKIRKAAAGTTRKLMFFRIGHCRGYFACVYVWRRRAVWRALQGLDIRSCGRVAQYGYYVSDAVDDGGEGDGTSDIPYISYAYAVAYRAADKGSGADTDII